MECIDDGNSFTLLVETRLLMDATRTTSDPPNASDSDVGRVGHSTELTEFLKRAKAKDHRALIDITVWGWGRIAGAVALFALFPNPLTYVIAIFFISSGMGILVALSHESQHSALLRNKKWNDRVGAWLCAYPVGSVYGSSRAVHLAHHKHLNTDMDPDRHFHIEDDKSTPEQFAAYFLRLLCGGQLWTSFVVNGFLRKPDADSVSSVPKAPTRDRKIPEVANLLPVQTVVFLTLYLVTGFWWAYFALWLVPIFTLGTFFGYLRGFIDHARLQDDDSDRAAGRLISVPNPSIWDRALLTGLDFHYHAEHHFFPSVPHYYLPELHDVLQRDPNFRDRYLVRPTYFSFLREYWNQIKNNSAVKSTTIN
ncbi:MAG TPA: fatty acid desaturase family protein [Drouetiella sp.]